MVLLPGIDAGASTSPLRSESMPTLPSSSGMRRSRSTFDEIPDPFERLRPPTEVRLRRMKYNIRPSSRGVSQTVRDANAELQSKYDALNEYDRPPHLDEPTPTAKAGVLPPIGGQAAGSVDLGKVAVDDIQSMLKEMNTLYSGGREGRPAPVAKKEEPKKEEPKRERRRQTQPPREPPKPGQSRITSRSAAKLYVRTTLERLREDDMERSQFANRVDALVAAEKTGPQVLIKQNAMLVRQPSAAYLEGIRERAAERYQREKERTVLVQEKKKEILDVRVGAIVAKLDRWEEARERRIVHEMRAGLLRRQSAWMNVIALIARTQRMGDKLVTFRNRRVELTTHMNSSSILAIAWRMYIMRRRLTALFKIRTAVRPLLFWWHFNFNIRKKRAAQSVILEYMRARKKLGDFNTFMKRYCNAVRKVQQAWRAAWKVLQSQLQICRMLWLLDDEKRGLSATAAQFAEQQERSYRLVAIRDDLRVRKGVHQERYKKYRKQKKEYDEYLLECDVMVEARALLNLPPEMLLPADAAGDGGEKRKPPLRPVFTLSSGSGHWATLSERVKAKMIKEQRDKDREWARQDSMRMEAEVARAPTRKGTHANLLKETVTPSPSPAPPRQSEDAVVVADAASLSPPPELS